MQRHFKLKTVHKETFFFLDLDHCPQTVKTCGFWRRRPEILGCNATSYFVIGG